MENYRVYELENRLRQLIIDSGLPPGIIYFVMDKITNELYNLYIQSVNKEIQEKQHIAESVAEGVTEKVQEAIASAPIEVGQE